jgi:pyrroline-5-carboxylate reductase
MKLAFIGGGTMSEAIIRGVLGTSLAKPGEIAVGEPLQDRRETLSHAQGVSVTDDNIQAIATAEVVVLSVKPQNLNQIFPELHGRIKKNQVVLSIIAGIKMSTLTKGLAHTSVIRTMPNTPAQIGKGMTVWTATDTTATSQREAVRSILQTLGEEAYVSDEKYLDMATAISGSGPAYALLFMEGLEDAGVYLGLPRDLARKLSVQTVLGTSALAKDTARPLAELRNMVTSPGGTTAAALLKLEAAGFRSALMEAAIAAFQKSASLGENS